MSCETRNSRNLTAFGLSNFLFVITEIAVFCGLCRLRFVYADFFWHIANLPPIRFGISGMAWVVLGLVIVKRWRGRSEEVGDILILADVTAMVALFVVTKYLHLTSDNTRIYVVHGTVGLVLITRCFYYAIAVYRRTLAWQWRIYLATCATYDCCRAIPRFLGIMGLEYAAMPLICGYIETFSPWFLLPAATALLLVEGLSFRKYDWLNTCSVILSTLVMATGIV